MRDATWWLVTGLSRCQGVKVSTVVFAQCTFLWRFAVGGRSSPFAKRPCLAKAVRRGWAAGGGEHVDKVIRNADHFTKPRTKATGKRE